MIFSFIQKWGNKKQLKEINEFNHGLKSMDDDEIALGVAMATHQRHLLDELYGWDLSMPVLCWKKDFDASLKLSRAIEELQKAGKQPVAAGVMVWLHTLRAMAPSATFELRASARYMWSQLQRGFPLVPQAASNARIMWNASMNIADFEMIPDGLSPRT